LSGQRMPKSDAQLSQVTERSFGVNRKRARDDHK